MNGFLGGMSAGLAVVATIITHQAMTARAGAWLWASLVIWWSAVAGYLLTRPGGP